MSLVNKILQKVMILIASVLVVISGMYLIHQGYLWPNHLFSWRYPTQGLDVSHHQGQIDWQQVAASGKYSFVYIKATEGHDFIDGEFVGNWQAAQEAGLAVGAYHFFSMRSSGQEQAEYFIAQVPRDVGLLRPVLDIEIALDHDPQLVRQEITTMADALQSYYGFV